MLTKSMVVSFLEQSPSPAQFKEQILNALLCSSPVERNRGIALRAHYSGATSYQLKVAESVLNDVFETTEGIFPGSFAVYGREKSFLSFLRKLLETDDVSQIMDHYALRIVLSDAVLGEKNTVDNYFFLLTRAIINHLQDNGFLIKPLLTKQDKGPSRELKRELYIPKAIPSDLIEYEPLFKNYVCEPKSNGYQGLHIVVVNPDGIFTEIQIWTTSMASRNNYGSAAHDGYKPKDELDRIVLERGDDFIELLTPKKIGKGVLTRNTHLERFPLDIL